MTLKDRIVRRIKKWLNIKSPSKIIAHFCKYAEEKEETK